MFMTADLPDPLGPMMATNSPAAMRRSTPRSAWNSATPRPYVFVTPCSSMIGTPRAIPTILLALRLHRLDDHLCVDGERAAGDLGAGAVGQADRHSHFHRLAALQDPYALLRVARCVVRGLARVGPRRPRHQLRDQPAARIAGARLGRRGRE